MAGVVICHGQFPFPSDLRAGSLGHDFDHVFDASGNPFRQLLPSWVRFKQHWILLQEGCTTGAIGDKNIESLFLHDIQIACCHFSCRS